MRIRLDNRFPAIYYKSEAHHDAYLAETKGGQKPKTTKSAFQCAPISMTGETIGQLVRNRRKFLGLRQRDLAELAGVTLRGLTALESGRGNPTLNQLAKIVDVLGLEIALVKRE